MFKLFVILISISDTGSIGMASMVTDFDSGPICESVERDFNQHGQFVRELDGHKITVSASAKCRDSSAPTIGSLDQHRILPGYGPQPEAPPPGYLPGYGRLPPSPTYGPPPGLPGYPQQRYDRRPPPIVQNLINGFLQGGFGR